MRIERSDTFIVSYPRSGNTWLRYIIASLIHRDREIDFDLVNRTVIDFYNNPNYLVRADHPRLIKSHEHFDSRYSKVVYIYRDGRDAAGSYFRFYQDNMGYAEPFEKFLKSMLKGDVEFGAWHTHVASWMQRSHVNPILYLKFEDLLENTEKVISRLCSFLELNVDGQLIEKAIKQSSIRNQNRTFEKTGRKGSAAMDDIRNRHGKWKEYYNEELQSLFFSKAGNMMARLGYKKCDFERN